MARNILYAVRPVAGGMREHLRLLVKHLNREEFVPYAVVPADDLLAGSLRDMGVETRVLPGIGSISPFKASKTALALRAIAKETEASVIHGHGYRAALAGGIAAKAAGVPFILTVHTELQGKSEAGIKGRAIQSIVGALSSRIVVVSQAIAGTFPEAKRRVIENGVELPVFEGERRPTGRVAYVGRLAPEKGVDLFLEAAKLLLDEGANHSFVVVGDGPLRAQLEGQARGLGIETSIEFMGFVEDAKTLLDSFDVLVLPSRSEGQPMVVLEAFAAGCPVVASNVGGVAGLLSDGCGIAVEPGDASAIGRAVKKVMADPEELGKIRETARRKVEKDYSAERMAERTMDVYREVLG
ncbi:MAG: glycosyltransferase family 4 protein [Candidatus Aquicultorales bacterium]